MSFVTLRRVAGPVLAWLPGLMLVPAREVNRSEKARAQARSRARLGRFAFFAAAMLFVLAVQTRMGAFRTERGLYSDDAAHFMNGLLIRDYLTHGLGSDPVRFAEQFYLNYPKIAPMMWPPLFHVVFGVCLLLGGSPAATALLLVGLACAWLVFRLHGIVDQLAGGASALIAAGLLLTTPMVLAISSVVMLDVVIAAFSLEAAYWLAKYCRSWEIRDAAGYGLFTALACLTKGNGVAVTLLPLVLIPLAGRFDLLRRAGVYVAALIVLVFAAPILSLSFAYDAKIGDFGPVSAAMVVSRLAFYSGHLWKNLGAVVLLLSAVGAVTTVARARRQPSFHLPLAESLVALAVAGILFHVLNPHTSSVSRYMTMVMAPIIGLALIAVRDALSMIKRAPYRLAATACALVAVLVATAATRVEAIATHPIGFRAMLSVLSARGRLAGSRVLVISDEFGEGAAVSEAAVNSPQPAAMIIRGSKFLADGGWNDSGALTHASAAALMQHLEDLHVNYILLDRSPGAMRLPYFSQVREVVETLTDRVAPLAVHPAWGTRFARTLELYRVYRESPGPPVPLKLNLSQTLGRTLQR